MIYKLQELIDNPDLLKSDPIKCNKCYQPLDALDLQEPSNSKGWCSDCYFELLGEEVEKYPICSPSVRKG
jgi:hypothetical protein